MLTVYYFTSYARVYTASKLKKAVRTFLKYKEGRTELLHTHTRHRTWSCLDTHNLRYSNRARAFEYGTETAPGPTLDSQNCKQRFSRLATGREFMLGGNRTRGESRARQATQTCRLRPPKCSRTPCNRNQPLQPRGVNIAENDLALHKSFCQVSQCNARG